MAEVWVDAEYRRLFKPQNIFEDMQVIQGEVVRAGNGRETLRFELKKHAFFLKRHSGIGWGEIIRDLFQGRKPILGARNEWQALQRLEILNISSLTPIAFGERGWNPASRQSFLVTEELKNTVSLEDVVKTWRERKDFVRVKRAIIRQLAKLARRMHVNGMNHRDFYICHIHVSQQWLDEPDEKPELFVIDLHRAQIRQVVPQRWLVKDIGSLLYSSLGAGITVTDLFRFMRVYRSMPLRDTLKDDREFWEQVEQRAEWLTSRTPREFPAD
jgi:heptose I phosphotransferase